MIKLAGIGHVHLRVADEEASKRFYRDVLGFRDRRAGPGSWRRVHDLGRRLPTLDIGQHPRPPTRPRPERGQLGLVHIAFRSAATPHCATPTPTSWKSGVEIQRAVDHVCQRSIYFTDPDGNGLEIYYEMPYALSLFPNGRGDEDEVLPLSRPAEPLPHGSSKIGRGRK